MNLFSIQKKIKEIRKNNQTIGLCHGVFDLLHYGHLLHFEAAKNILVEQWGGVDIVINNAGVASAGNFADTPIDTWEWMLGINLMGAVKGCKVFTPLFQQQGAGHFVNIASMAGLLNPPGMADYNVAKAGVIALSETLRSELAPHNILTTVVCPSFSKTNLGESLKSTDQVSSDSFSKLLDRSELSAADIAAIIVAAVNEGEFLVMPHEKAREAYQHKCAKPAEHFQTMATIAQRTLAKQQSN